MCESRSREVRRGDAKAAGRLVEADVLAARQRSESMRHARRPMDRYAGTSASESVRAPNGPVGMRLGRPGRRTASRSRQGESSFSATTSTTTADRCWPPPSTASSSLPWTGTPGPGQTVRAVAADAHGEREATLDAGALADWRNPSPPPKSLDYVRGLIAGLRERPALTPRLPASIAIAGDVPIGFGVSSSAALCVSLALALAEGFSAPEEMVLLAQEAEHRAGTPCGTDGPVSLGLRRGHRLRWRHPWPSSAYRRLLGDLVFVVADPASSAASAPRPIPAA